MWWIFFIIIAVIIAVYVIYRVIYRVKEVRHELYMEKLNQKHIDFQKEKASKPLFWYKEGKFFERTNKIHNSLNGMRALGDFVGAKDVMNKIADMAFFVSNKVIDENFNSFLANNPKEIDNAVTKLVARLDVAERACEKLASAFTEQEIGVDPEQLDAIIKEAEKILENQTKSDAEFMQELSRMQNESDAKLMQEVDQIQSENESEANQRLMQ